MPSLCGYSLLLTFFVMSLIVHVNATKCPRSLQLNQSQIAHNISKAIVQIVENFFLTKYRRKSFNLLVKVRNPRHIYFFQDVIDWTWKLLNGSISIHMGHGIPIPVSENIQYSVLLVDSTESLM